MHVNSSRFFQNRECEYFPCHTPRNGDTEDFSCLMCYCPLYSYRDCGGNYTLYDGEHKDCSLCDLPHYNYEYIITKLEAKL